MKSRYVAILLIFTVQFVKAQVDFTPVANSEMYGGEFNALYSQFFNKCMSSTAAQGNQASSSAMNSVQAKENYCKNYAIGLAQSSLQIQLQEQPFNQVP